MKRLLVRVSALAIVLALGLIAIAHAQWGFLGSGQQTVQGAAELATTAADAARAQGPPPPASSSAPRTLPLAPQANPIRSGSGPFAASPVRATAVAAEETPASAATPKAAETRADASPRPSDPFGLSTRTQTGSSPRDAVSSAPPQAPNPIATATDRAGPAAGQSAATPEPLAGTQVSSEPALLKQDPSPGSAAAPRALNSPGIRGPRLSLEAGPANPPQADASRIGEGTGKPGSPQLEGPQTPQLTLQKSAPPEVQVGKPATFQIRLRNTGSVPAHNVEIRDEVPKGARLAATSPRASRGVRGELLWQLGTLKPADEVTVEVQIVPVDEGEIGSVATVSFTADASARATATKPQLALRTSGPSKVLIGEEVPLSITVSNSGSGIARKVVLEERVPPGLQHPAGPELEYEIGDLKPNESRQLELKLTAAQAGRIGNVLAARGDANLRVEDRFELEVLAPQLDVALDGPKRRYLEREATYTFSVSNPGTAPARQVQLVAQLPPGLKFVSANNAGHYDESTRTVQWLLEELPVRETGSVELVAMPVEIGAQTLRLRGSAEKGLSVEKEQPVVIEGIAAILFEITDTCDPIEVNGETTYDIRVVNQGSKAAGNVQLVVQLPPEMRFVAAEGPTRQIVEGTRVAFEPLVRLAPKANTTYRVRVQGLKPGDLRIRASLLTDEIRVPVTKEESTRVYSDE
jgi:uncharacterized repeat protein (TIGR01451 family)